MARVDIAAPVQLCERRADDAFASDPPEALLEDDTEPLLPPRFVGESAVMPATTRLVTVLGYIEAQLVYEQEDKRSAYCYQIIAGAESN